MSSQVVRFFHPDLCLQLPSREAALFQDMPKAVAWAEILCRLALFFSSHRSSGRRLRAWLSQSLGAEPT